MMKVGSSPFPWLGRLLAQTPTGSPPRMIYTVSPVHMYRFGTDETTTILQPGWHCLSADGSKGQSWNDPTGAGCQQVGSDNLNIM